MGYNPVVAIFIYIGTGFIIEVKVYILLYILNQCLLQAIPAPIQVISSLWSEEAGIPTGRVFKKLPYLYRDIACHINSIVE